MVLGKLPMSGVLLILIIVGQGLSALAAGAGRIVWTFFLPPLSISPWETARYRLKYCLEGSLSPKTINQTISGTAISDCHLVRPCSSSGYTGCGFPCLSFGLQKVFIVANSLHFLYHRSNNVISFTLRYSEKLSVSTDEVII